MSAKLRASRAIVLSVLVLGCGGTIAGESGPRTAPTTETPPASSRPPLAEVRPVTDTYHGVEVVDPYQWLEDPNDPAVRAWNDAQNVYARRHLAALPGVDTIRERVRAIVGHTSVRYFDLHPAGGRLFALEERPPREQPAIVVMSSADDPGSSRVVLDPTRMDASGAVAIDWFEPSPDGRLVAGA